LLQTQKKKKMVFKRDMPLRGALNTISKFVYMERPPPAAIFFFFWGLLKTFKSKKTRAPPGPLQPRRPPVAKKIQLKKMKSFLLLLIKVWDRNEQTVKFCGRHCLVATPFFFEDGH
jgi:hypothetical protein